MIYTITFNPALDISGVVERLVPDEKSYVTNVVQTPGGNGVNAGIIASRLGADVQLTGFAGGANGEEVKYLLNKQRVKHHFIEIQTNTRINVTVTSSQSEKQTRLSFPGPQIYEKDWNRLFALTKKFKALSDLVIIGGSLPPGIKVSQLTSLVLSLRKRGVFCVVDIPPPGLKAIIKSRPNFIKPNLKEFQELTGCNVYRIKDVLKKMKELNKYVPLISVSSVEGGALVVNDKEAWFGKTPRLKIQSTVGAGDSMVGAISTLLASDPDTPIADLLRIGLAASSATLTEPGLTLGSKKAIRSFVPRIKLRKINL